MARAAKTRPLPETALPLWHLGQGVPPQGRFVAVVPGTEAAAVSLALPSGLTGPARQAVAQRMLHDRLGPGYALRPLGEGAFTQALVVAETSLAAWRDSLGGAAARCVLVPDYLALPQVEGGWTVSVEGALVLVRLGPHDGFSAESALARAQIATLLARLRAEGQPLPPVLRLGTEDAELDALLAAFPRAAGVRGDSAPGDGIDLLRDPAASAPARAAGRWALVAGLVLTGALGWALAQGLHARNDRLRAEALSVATLQAVRRDLIPEGPILDLRAQVERALAARRAGAGGDVLATARRAAPALAMVQVTSLSIGAEGTGVEVSAPDFAALDALVAELARLGVQARLLRSGLGEGGVEASLALERAP